MPMKIIVEQSLYDDVDAFARITVFAPVTADSNHIDVIREIALAPGDRRSIDIPENAAVVITEVPRHG